MKYMVALILVVFISFIADFIYEKIIKEWEL